MRLGDDSTNLETPGAISFDRNEERATTDTAEVESCRRDELVITCDPTFSIKGARNTTSRGH
jgi:hypothetical protein